MNELRETFIKIAPNRFVSIYGLTAKRKHYNGKRGRPDASDYILNDISPATRTRLVRNLKAKKIVVRTKRIAKIKRNLKPAFTVIAIWILVGVLAGYSNSIETLVKAMDTTMNTPIVQKVEASGLKEEVQPTKVNKWTGIASYYSVAGCVGCREDLLMANGVKFDEDAMTLAFNWLPLNTKVKVINTLTGESMNAVVTDTGGFNELGRIADLSKGLKEAINCTDLCPVEVVEL